MSRANGFDTTIETRVGKAARDQNIGPASGDGVHRAAELAAAIAGASGLRCIGSDSMSWRELKEQIRRSRALSDRQTRVEILFAEVKDDPNAQP